jgi:hypothetical protein
MVSEIDVRPAYRTQTFRDVPVVISGDPQIAPLGNVTGTVNLSMTGYTLVGLQNVLTSNYTGGSPITVYQSGNAVKVFNVSQTTCNPRSGGAYLINGKAIYVRSDLT